MNFADGVLRIDFWVRHGDREILLVMDDACEGCSTIMVDELALHGIRNAADVATCLVGYGQTNFPRRTDWSVTRFYLQQAVDAGYRLVDDAQVLWDAFAAIHNKAGLAGALEIPMESFTLAVEIVLK